MLVFLLFHIFAFKGLHYGTRCLFFLYLEKFHISLSSQLGFFFNVTIFPVLYYEYDCNTVCRNSCIMVHSLVDRLSYHEVILFITLGCSKAVIFLLLHYQCLNYYTCKKKYEFLFHIIFSFLMSTVSNTHVIYSVWYCIR